MLGLRQFVTETVKHRELVWELTRRELFQPQVNHVLGRYWFFLHPGVTVAVYFIVFSYVFVTRAPGHAERGVEVYFLAGIIPWVTMSELMGRACRLITGNANLVKQIVFPLETLVAKTVLAAVLVQVVMSLFMFAILLGTSRSVAPIFIALWLGALVLQTIFMTGLTLVLASTTPFVPDVEDVVLIFLKAGFFLAPILYLPGMLSERVWRFFYFNPFSYFIWIHQNAVFDEAIVLPWAWLGAFLIALATLAVGSWWFRSLSPSFGDVI